MFVIICLRCPHGFSADLTDVNVYMVVYIVLYNLFSIRKLSNKLIDSLAMDVSCCLL